MTGYALAFPHHSKYKSMFNEKILELRENGKLDWKFQSIARDNIVKIEKLNKIEKLD